MYNLVKAAEAGYAGEVAGARDYELVWRARDPLLLRRGRYLSRLLCALIASSRRMSCTSHPFPAADQ